jgi:hypothetical protein
VLDDSRGGFFGVNNGSSVTESIHEHCNLRRRDKQGVLACGSGDGEKSFGN